VDCTLFKDDSSTKMVILCHLNKKESMMTTRVVARTKKINERTLAS
jgi:hypothetical protein